MPIGVVYILLVLKHFPAEKVKEKIKESLIHRNQKTHGNQGRSLSENLSREINWRWLKRDGRKLRTMKRSDRKRIGRGK